MSSKSIEAFTAVQKNLKLLRQELKTLQRQEPKPASKKSVYLYMFVIYSFQLISTHI